MKTREAILLLRGCQIKRNKVLTIALMLCSFYVMTGICMESVEAVCLANHTEMTLNYALFDPTGKLSTITGILGKDDVPKCYPGAHPKYGSARNVYFFNKQAFNEGGYYNVYMVHGTVARNSTVVFAIQKGLNGTKDMTQIVLHIVDENGKLVYDGVPDGPWPWSPKPTTGSTVFEQLRKN